MNIKMVKNERGANKYGTCNECSASSQDDEGMKRIRFSQITVCLCTKCFSRFAQIVELFNDVEGAT